MKRIVVGLIIVLGFGHICFGSTKDSDKAGKLSTSDLSAELGVASGFKQKSMAKAGRRKKAVADVCAQLTVAQMAVLARGSAPNRYVPTLLENTKKEQQ